MRETFWQELNEARQTREVKYWPGIFPEATIINFDTLLQQNQYVSRVSNNDIVMDQYSSNLPGVETNKHIKPFYTCLLYTSPSPRDKRQSRMPSSA